MLTIHQSISSRGAFLFSQHVLPLLLNSTTMPSPQLPHPPTLIFTGATAAIKGSAMTSAFSTGKFALRSLTQSLAKEFGPKGIHVCHAIVDGVIDTPKTKGFMEGVEGGKISPEAVSLQLFLPALMCKGFGGLKGYGIDG